MIQTELILEGHAKLHGIKAVQPERLNEVRLQRHLRVC
jgi:hypothetical protein